MALIRCPECGKSISDSAENCPQCGFKLTADVIDHLREAARQATKKSESKKRILYTVGAFGCLALTGCLLSVFAIFYSTIRQVDNEIKTPKEVVYRITGTASKASITYANPSGGVEQIDSVSLPWEKKFEAYPGAHLYISAQNRGEYGSVECLIHTFTGYRRFSESSGAYTIATCSGMLP